MLDFNDLSNISETIYNHKNITFKFINNENNRLLISINNNTNYDSDLLIIANKDRNNTKKEIEKDKSSKIIELMVLFNKKNIYNNIFVMNILNDDYNNNIEIFKKIFNFYPNINVLLCYGGGCSKNKILEELNKIFIDKYFYEKQLVKCFQINKDKSPRSYCPPGQSENIKDIIEKKVFNEYENYNIYQ